MSGEQWWWYLSCAVEAHRGVMDGRGRVIADCGLDFEALIPHLGYTMFDEPPSGIVAVCPGCAAAVAQASARPS